MGGRESLANDLCLLIETLSTGGKRDRVAEPARELAELVEQNVNQRHPARAVFALAFNQRILASAAY
jgi:hypothetical protein